MQVFFSIYLHYVFLYLYFLQPKAAEKLTAMPKTGGGISMFVTCQTKKPAGQKVSVSEDSVDNGLSSKEEAKCALESHQEKQEGSRSKIKLSNNIKRNVMKHAEKKGGRGKSKNMDTNDLLSAKKRKRIVVVSDSEDSSDDGE
jgi:hypothetical protein